MSKQLEATPDNHTIDQSIRPDELENATGGMNWQDFPRSKNVEDRRSPGAIRRDQQWWDSMHPVQQPAQPATDKK